MGKSTDIFASLQTVIGGTEKGYVDGDYRSARFASPQGVALYGTDLYVADTENHTIRKVDLKTKIVDTIAGTGCHGDDKEGGNQGNKQPLSSPWDVCLCALEGSDEPSVLYIAMAGTHQIWAYTLKEASVLQNRDVVPVGWCVVVAGSGVEENRNNSYPQKAGFAQPSGLSLSQSKHTLFIADSESSSIRSLDLKTGAVKNMAGGDIDPRNLFAYGDEDGKGTKAKLQHPLGVAMVTDDGPLFVADSYNHKIKTIDISTKICETKLGTGTAGNSKGDNLLNQEFNEPGGLCVDRKHNKVYIADTNNHDIKVLNLDTQSVYSFPILGQEEALSDYDELDNSETTSGPHIDVTIDITCATGIHLNEKAPNSWTLFSNEENLQKSLTNCGATLKGTLSQDQRQTLTRLPESSVALKEGSELCLKLNLFVCEDSGICRMDNNKVLTGTVNTSKENPEINFNLQVT